MAAPAVRIRPETPADHDAVADLLRRAFDGDDEAQLVERIRAAPGFEPDLSLVAEKGGRVVGYILFSPIHIARQTERLPALALAPMAVLPEDQRQGLGSCLVHRGLQACRSAGHRIVIVLGHAAYYPRFGFQRADRHGITSPFPCPDDSFMVLPLIPGALRGATGRAVYPDAFSPP